jgi:hypothetical protein
MMEPFRLVARAIVECYIVPGAEQTSCHGRAHFPESDKSEVHAVSIAEKTPRNIWKFHE